MRTAWNLYTPARQGAKSSQAAAFYPFPLLQCWHSQSLSLATSSFPVNHPGVISLSEKCLLPTQMSSYLAQSVPWTGLPSNYTKLCLYRGRVRAQPEIEAGQLCWSTWNHTLICIPNLSSSQHSPSLKRIAARYLQHTKINKHSCMAESFPLLCDLSMQSFKCCKGPSSRYHSAVLSMVLEFTFLSSRHKSLTHAVPGIPSTALLTFFYPCTHSDIKHLLPTMFSYC